MKLDRLIRIIDNKEYVSVEPGEIERLTWFDIKLKNENLIRIEKCYGVDGEADRFIVLYIEPNDRKATRIWHGNYEENSYYIFSNIYNELKIKFK